MLILQLYLFDDFTEHVKSHTELSRIIFPDQSLGEELSQKAGTSITWTGLGGGGGGLLPGGDEDDDRGDDVDGSE